MQKGLISKLSPFFVSVFGVSIHLKVKYVRSGASVILGLGFAVIGAFRNKSYSARFQHKTVFNESLMIILNLDNSLPFSVFINYLNYVMLHKTLRKTEGGAVMAKWEE